MKKREGRKVNETESKRKIRKSFTLFCDRPAVVETMSLQEHPLHVGLVEVQVK